MSTARRPLHVTALEDRIVPAPVINSVFNTGPADEGSSVMIAASATSNAGGLYYEFDYNGDGVYDETSATGVVNHTFADNGTYTVAVRATDASGSATATTVVTVRNVAPTLSNVTITPAVAEGGTATLTG